jgi:predicted nucleotidyltransferase
MLEVMEITRSRLRKELLRLYFTNPEKEYYLRELERLLGFSAANIRRELLKLKKSGLFKTRRKGNLLYYSLNKDHPLYEEIKNIVFKTIGIEGSLREIMNEIRGVEVALIYGSFAAGKETEMSDIDLLIIGNPDEERLMTEIDELEERLKREINYTIYSKTEYNNRKRKKDTFIQNILERPKILLKGTEDEL